MLDKDNYYYQINYDIICHKSNVQNSHSAIFYFISTLYLVIFLYTQYRSELTLKLAFNSVILHAPFKNLDLQIVWLTILLSSNAFDIRICSKGPPNQNINYLVRQIIISYSQHLFAKLIYEKKSTSDHLSNVLEFAYNAYAYFRHLDIYKNQNQSS